MDPIFHLWSLVLTAAALPHTGSRSKLQNFGERGEKKKKRKKERGNEQARERERLTTALRAVTTDKTSARLRSLSSCTLMHSRAKNTDVWKSRGCCCCAWSCSQAPASRPAACPRRGECNPGQGQGHPGVSPARPWGWMCPSEQSHGKGWVCADVEQNIWARSFCSAGREEERSGLGEKASCAERGKERMEPGMGMTQGGFAGWQRGRTKPGPCPLGWEASGPKISLMRCGNELPAVSQAQLLIYRAGFSPAVVTLSEAREQEHTSPYT